jgi:hypothetical protein
VQIQGQIEVDKKEEEEESGTDPKQKPLSGGNRISLSRHCKLQRGRKSHYQNRWAETEQLTQVEPCLFKRVYSEIWEVG